jgi:hypothetical protein
MPPTRWRRTLRPTSPIFVRWCVPTSTRWLRGWEAASAPETSSAPEALAPVSDRTCSSAGHPASPFRSRASGSTGSGTVSTLPPACFRPTQACWSTLKPTILHPRERLCPHLRQQGKQASLRSVSRRRSTAAGYHIRCPGAQCSRLRRAAGSSTAVHRRRPQGRASFPSFPIAYPPRSDGNGVSPPKVEHDPPHHHAVRPFVDSSREPESEESCTWQLGTPPPRNPARRELLAPHCRAGTPESDLQVALSLLVLPPETRPGSARTDDPSATRAERRAVPLGQSPPPNSRAAATLHLPG